MLDVERARALTPGCRRVVHLNHAGASLMPTPVLDTVVSHLRREAEIGGYEAADEVGDRLEAVYRSAARLVGAAPDEIALVENATRAWDMAFYSFRFEPGDRILIGRAEYVSNVIAELQVARRKGVTVELVDDDEHGQIDVAALERRIDDRVRLVALTHVPTNGGLVNPAAEVGRVARAAGVPFVLDACQSAGQLALDVNRLGCDVLALTGRKYLRGPRGTGVLYVRRELIDGLEPPFLELRSATWTGPDRYEIAPGARRFETWERNVAGLLGLGAAIDHALDWGIDAIEARVVALGEGLRDRLRAIDGVAVHDKGARRCGIVAFTVSGVDPEEVRRRLAAQRINTSVSPRTSAQLDLPGRGLGDLVRASVHYVNTEDELDRAAEAVASLRRRGAAAPKVGGVPLPERQEVPMAVKPIPDEYPRVTPYLCVDGAAAAIEFYSSVLGASERMRMPAPEGKIGHAELRLGDSMMMLSDEFPDMGGRSPKTIGGTPVIMNVYVEDVDAVFERAVQAGATVLRPVENQFYGDRSGQFEDPFGHQWNVATHVEDVPPDEMERRVAQAMGGG